MTRSPLRAQDLVAAIAVVILMAGYVAALSSLLRWTTEIIATLRSGTLRQLAR